jgi:hypothetical protein
LGKVVCRNRERDEHRLELRDRHHLRAVGGDQVARLSREVARAPVDGETGFGISELHLGGVDG